MAKIAFSKLNAKTNSEIKSVGINNQVIEIKQYLPFEEKVRIIENIINVVVANNQHYYNPAQVEIFKVYYIIEHYTNLTFTEKQKQDLAKIYDALVSTDCYKQIVQFIPEEELDTLEELLHASLRNVYAYFNSVYHVIESMGNNYGALNMDVQDIINNLQNNAGLVNDIKDMISEVSVGNND